MDTEPVEPIYVTKPYLPPLEELVPFLEQIWSNRVLTNNGPFHQEFEHALREYLGVQHVSLFSNGMMALIVALQALRISGEVITTPYSFVATTHALQWNGITPVFVDIDPVSMNLDPCKVEAAITPRTTAILPVHVYGNPCDVDALQKISDIYGIKVIYDAAHAFGVRKNGRSILDHGDLSVLSFHATKLFNTFEGGAIISNDLKTKQRIDLLKNFGFYDETTVIGAGINGKMNELQSVAGIVQLRHVGRIMEMRHAVAQRYRAALAPVRGIRMYAIPEDVIYNNAYFPILVERDYPLSRDQLYARLKEHGVFPRRYFYPLISEFPMYRGLPSAGQGRLPVAHRIASQILCLPIYPELSYADQDRVLDVIVEAV